MRLYKFLNAKYGLAAIKDRRLRISRLEELNDEFEFIGIALSVKEERIAMRRMRSQLGENRGLICMSKSWSSPLLWGHYGDSYRGMALGFDVPDGLFYKVDYVPELPTLTALGYTSADQLTEADINGQIRRKFDGWEYEEEYRAFVGFDEAVMIDGVAHYFLDFGGQLKLREVIVGHRSELGRQDIAIALGDLEPAVERFRARAAFDDFKMVRNRDETMWR